MDRKFGFGKITFSLGILFLCLIIYWPGIDYPFSHLDDYEQILQNKAVLNFDLVGLFSQKTVGMYQPLSSLFFALVAKLFGMESNGFHLLSLVFHLANSILLFRLLRKLNFSDYLSLFLVSIFVLHPMQVEAVSWISAFSTLCSVFFILCGLLAYIKYQTQSKLKDYWLCFLYFLLACLSKSLAVIFPLFLVLLDYYHFENKNWQILKNKLLFFLLSLGFGLLTVSLRDSAGHLSDLSQIFSGFDRIFLVSYNLFFYLFKFILPFNLSAFYPFPEMENNYLDWPFYLSALAAVAIGVLLYKKRAKSKVLLGVGIYLVSLVLLIQIIPLGNQLNCERYLYLASLGLLIIVGVFLEKIQHKKWRLFLLLIPIVLTYQSFQRSQVWENDEKLWKNVLTQFPKVAQAYNNLGSLALDKNKNKEAITYLNQAIKFKPYYADAYSNRGSYYLKLGQTEKALADLNQAIQLKEHPDAYFNRGNAYAGVKKYKEAIADYSASIKLQKRADVFTNRAYVYAQKGDIEKAFQDLETAIKINPKFAQAYFLRAMLYQSIGNLNSCCKDLSKATKLNHPKSKRVQEEICFN